MSISHGNNKTKQVKGEAAAQLLLGWLQLAMRSSNPEAALSLDRVQRISRLLVEMKAFEAKALVHRRRQVVGLRKSGWNANSLEPLNTLNSMLRNYRFYPEFVFGAKHYMRATPVGFSETVEYEPAGVGAYVPYSEGDAVSDLLKLAADGVIDRIRFCENCKAAYFAKIDRGRFCSDECREYFHAHSDETRLKKRASMQRLRAKRKEQARRQKEYFDKNIKRKKRKG
jgi:hypothetical protein